MLERLVVDPQLKLVTMLNYAEAVLSYSEWEQESSLVPKKFVKDLVRQLIDYLRIILVDYLLVLKNLLLSREHTVVQFHGVVFAVEVELPQEKLFRPIISKIVRIDKLRLLTISLFCLLLAHLDKSDDSSFLN